MSIISWQPKISKSQKGHGSGDRLRIDAATYGSTIVLIVGIIITAIFQPVFLTVSNIANVLSQIAVLGILTMAQTIVLISGGIDLSVGSNVALSGVVAGLLFMHGVPLWIDCVAALACATVIGLINGVLIAQNRAHPFIITLGMLTLLEGIAELITGGSPVNDMGALVHHVGWNDLFWYSHGCGAAVRGGGADGILSGPDSLGSRRLRDRRQ